MPSRSSRAGLVITIVALGAVGLTVAIWFSRGRPTTPVAAPVAATPARPADTAPVATAPAAPTTRPPPPAARTYADRRLAEAEAAVHAAPDDPLSHAALAVAFMGKARETADASYYARAEAACQKALALDPDAYDALRVLPWVYNGQHRFREAKEAAERALKVNPNDPWNYGMLGDALAELGEYEPAEDAYDEMMNRRPDVASYARQSYMGELYGDTDFALDTMRKARTAANPADTEMVAWCHARLGDILFDAGRGAEAEYETSLKAFPDYYAALAGLARVRAAQGKAEEAVALYQRSLRAAPTELALAHYIDLLAHLGRREEAERQFALVEAMQKIAAAGGVRPGAATALLYADHDRDVAGALRTAEQCAAGQQDVRTMDALAWALYKNGRFEEARRASEKALRLGTRDAKFHYHAGMIALRLGDRAAAAASLRTALEINPHFSPRHAAEAKATLKTLDAAGPTSRPASSPSEAAG